MHFINFFNCFFLCIFLSCSAQLSYSLCFVYETKEFKFAVLQFDFLRGVRFLSFLCFQEGIFGT